jgi:polysaccharide export outer membrane protein
MRRIDDMNNNEIRAGDRQTGVRKPFTVAWAVMLAMAVTVGLISCQNPNPPTLQQAVAPTAVTLVSGDVIKLSFPGAPELSQSQKIRTDGKVNLPLIGEIDAAGKTVPAFQRDLSDRYKTELKTSTVTVTLESSVTQVTISGAVARGGKLTFERPTTVFQAIMEAGGVSEFGTLRNVHVIRMINGLQQTQVLDLRPVTSGRPTTPYYVRDQDVIFVPRTMF